MPDSFSCHAQTHAIANTNATHNIAHIHHNAPWSLSPMPNKQHGHATQTCLSAKKSRQVLDVLYVATKAGQRGASSTVCMLLGGSPQYGGVPTQQVMRSAARRRTLWRRTCNESGRAFRETAKGCLHENRRCQLGGALQRPKNSPISLQTLRPGPGVELRARHFYEQR